MKKLRSTISISLLAVLFVVSSQFAAAQVVRERIDSANVSADRQKFAAGDQVKINGAGFGAGESVTLEASYVAPDETRTAIAIWTVITGKNGDFETFWTAGYEGKFIIRATGVDSRTQSETTPLSVVTPVVVSGNPSCATLNGSSNPAFAHITESWGLKIDPPAGGTFTFTNGTGRLLTGGAPSDALNSISVLNLTGTTFDWSATKLITAVIVKGGPNANVYPYNPESLGDTLLTTVGGGGFGISHLEFCFQNTKMPSSVTIIKDAQPNTTQNFSFGATGQVTQNFNLVDNGVVGPDRITFSGLTLYGPGNSITVTEGVPSGFYQLTQINCTSNATNNNTISVATRTATIVLEPGENVVCTFVNTVVTAANASVGGRVFDAFGRPLRRATVSVQNVSTGEIRVAQTNQFGRYRIDDLPVGEFYIATVSHRKNQFVNETVSFTLNDVVDDLDFTAIAP